MKIRKFNENFEMTIEEKRLERLRNLLNPLFSLAQMASDNDDGDFDDLIKETADKCEDVLPLIEKALDSKTTLEELGQLYVDPKNREIR